MKFDNGTGFVDDLLVNGIIPLTHGVNVWDGLLIPYSGRWTLTRDANGDVQGTHGSSGEAVAQVHQQLLDDGAGASNLNSAVIDVP